MTMSSSSLSFPLRVNINFRLSSPVRDFVIEMNSKIVDDGFADIDFTQTGAPFPHITLLMGELQNLESYNGLLSTLNRFAESTHPVDYSLELPYLSLPSQQYIFSDVLPQEPFRRYRQDLFEELAELIVCEDHGGPDNVTHVTIGYAETPYSRMQLLIDSYRRVEGRTDVVQVCRAGNHGTCIEVLDQFETHGVQ